MDQVLTLNGLRQNVVLRTDGGIKTGRDVVIAAIMGAEFGVGTTSLVAIGCIMVKAMSLKHVQLEFASRWDLRARFSGSPEKWLTFSYIAEEVREILAKLGFKAKRNHWKN